jgi:hypothetical protein
MWQPQEERAAGSAARSAEPERAEGPAHVAILGLGPSLESYVDHVKRLGGRSAFCDEVWAINALGDVLACDRVFHMDDVAIQEIRAAAKPRSNIAMMLPWLKRHPGPIYTSVVREGYPGLVAFPLEDVVNGLGYAYFNNTAAYAIAFAIHIGVKQISFFGIDFTYPNAHDAEKGRACCEFWLGQAAARGIRFAMPDRTTLMDTNEGAEELRCYGYDAVKLSFDQPAPGAPVKIGMAPRETLPTADEIEGRYDHTRHPNSIVDAAGKGTS